MTVYPFEGKVTLKGEPAAGARIVFHPNAPFEDKDADYPRAVAGEDGTFRLTTYEDDDGAPAGDYRVTIDMATQAEGLQKREDPLKGRYRDPARSGLTAVVKAGQNEPVVFPLK